MKAISTEIYLELMLGFPWEMKLILNLILHQIYFSKICETYSVAAFEKLNEMGNVYISKLKSN